MNRLLLCTLAFFSINNAATAGPRVGNGGGAWICQENSGAFRWLKLVDLFEAQNEYGLRLISQSGAEPWDLVNTRFDFLQTNAPTLAQRLSTDPAQLRSVVQMVPKFTELTRIDDDQIRVKPSPATCQGGTLYYGQVANYTFDGRLLIATDIWNDPGFSDLDRAALLLHEIIYKSLRDRDGDTDSSRARAIVALAFSSLAPAELNARVNAVLAQPDPGLAPILARPYQLICFGDIESETSTTEPGPTLRLTASSPGLLAGALERFAFSVRTDPGGTTPLELSVTDQQTGIRTTLDQESVTNEFRRNAKVALSLELTNDQKIVSLECRAQPFR